MSYPPPNNHYYQQPQHRQPSPGLNFLGMSGGILLLVIALVIVLPILCCVGLFFTGIIGAAVSPDPSMTPSFDPSYGG